MRRRIIVLAVSWILCTASISCSEPPGAATAPAATEFTTNGPVGLYFMTRYWSYTRTLEKAAWYFSADGKVFQNLQTGFSPADLAAHHGPKGTYVLANGQLVVQWADGKTSTSPVERDETNPAVFMWDMGIFTPVQRFADSKAAAGTYDGGESLAGGGNRVSVGQTLQLNANGSYVYDRAAVVAGAGDRATIEAGSSGRTTGKWTLSGYSLTLEGSDGQTTRGIFFPVDDDSTPVQPDHVFFAGMLFKRK